MMKWTWWWAVRGWLGCVAGAADGQLPTAATCLPRGPALTCRASPPRPAPPLRPTFAAAAFSVTPERKTLVRFLKPFLYSAGCALYAPGGAVDGVDAWADLKGRRVASREGYYANDALQALGAELVMVQDAEGGRHALRRAAAAVHTCPVAVGRSGGTRRPADCPPSSSPCPAEAEAAVQAGRAQAYAADSVAAELGSLERVKELQPISVSAYAMAVQSGDNQVAAW